MSSVGGMYFFMLDSIDEYQVDEQQNDEDRVYSSEELILHDQWACEDSECMMCSVLDCPHKEPLHYDDDGCPACHAAERVENVLSD